MLVRSFASAVVAATFFFASASANAGLFHNHGGCGCDAAPSCGGCEVAPSCGCEVGPSCCDAAPSCGPRFGHIRGLIGRLHARNACAPVCAPACACAPVCEPVCAPVCAPVCEPACAPACDSCDVCAPSCGHRHRAGGLLRAIKARCAAKSACCAPACDSCSSCDSCGAPAGSCGCGM